MSILDEQAEQNVPVQILSWRNWKMFPSKRLEVQTDFQLKKKDFVFWVKAHGWPGLVNPIFDFVSYGWKVIVVFYTHS